MSAEDKIRRTFDIALQFSEGKPVVALIDEIDQMGEGYNAGKELLSVTSGATSDRYKNIIIVATTNEIRRLSSALLRSERLGKKMLINYPGPRDLKEIVRKVTEEFYDEIHPRTGGPKALGSRSRDSFVNEFSKLAYDEIGKDNYALMIKDILFNVKEEDLPESINPTDKKTLFTGADVKAILFESLSIMEEQGQETLKKEHVKEATKRIYQYNLANPG
jgi:SpoVK/Ycf46/Vps4 family AAA+-type ATPase